VFNGFAAEVDTPREKQATEYLARQSFWRAPYMCSFRAGNFDFIVITTHARWGDSIPGRKAELQLLADWIDTRFKDKSVEDHDLIVMGDFNVPALDDPLYSALTSRGLQIPLPLRKLQSGDQVIGGTNLEKNARYDQILHLPTVAANFMRAGGTLDFFIDDAHIAELFPDKKYTRQQFSFPTICRSGFRSRRTSTAIGWIKSCRTAGKGDPESRSGWRSGRRTVSSDIAIRGTSTVAFGFRSNGSGDQPNSGWGAQRVPEKRPRSLSFRSGMTSSAMNERVMNGASSREPSCLTNASSAR
jgi:hypothetical protein